MGVVCMILAQPIFKMADKGSDWAWAHFWGLVRSRDWLRSVTAERAPDYFSHMTLTIVVIVLVLRLNTEQAVLSRTVLIIIVTSINTAWPYLIPIHTYPKYS